jgi:hypothetical protein
MFLHKDVEEDTFRVYTSDHNVDLCIPNCYKRMSAAKEEYRCSVRARDVLEQPRFRNTSQISPVLNRSSQALQLHQ